MHIKILKTHASKLNSIEKLKIDGFIEDNNGLVFHETKFNEVASIIFQSELFYYIAYKENQIIGICPLQRIKDGLLGHNYSNNGNFEIPYGGWVYDKNIANFQDLWNRTAKNPFESLIYTSTFFDESPENGEKTCERLQTGLINLDYSENELLNNVVHAKRRNMIKKAIKTGVLIKEFGNDGMEIYSNLMSEMKKKTELKMNPLEYYKEIINAYAPENAKILLAFLGNKPLSGVIIIGNKNVMHYWQGASANDAPNLGQGELLQWEAIRWAKKVGAKYYDLCVIEPERLPNIAKFKMGFTGGLLPFYRVSKKHIVFKVMNRLQNVFIH